MERRVKVWASYGMRIQYRTSDIWIKFVIEGQIKLMDITVKITSFVIPR